MTSMPISPGWTRMGQSLTVQSCGPISAKHQTASDNLVLLVWVKHRISDQFLKTLILKTVSCYIYFHLVTPKHLGPGLTNPVETAQQPWRAGHDCIWKPCKHTPCDHMSHRRRLIFRPSAPAGTGLGLGVGSDTGFPRSFLT